MRPSRLFAPVSALLVLLVTIAPGRPGFPGPGHLLAPSDLAETKEIDRIRAHFDSVLAELGTRDVSALNERQRENRVQLVTTLAGYRDRGVFPHNYDFSQPTPYFVDRKTGTLCAVGYLIASTGRSDIVRRVTLADNNVYVAQLAGDTALSRWLDANGLTLEEAARIQIVYVQSPSMVTRAGNTMLYAAGSTAIVGSLVSSVWNASDNRDGHNRLGRVLGLASGIVATSMGAAIMMQRREAPQGVAPAMLGIGGLSLALATHGILHHANVMKEQRASTRKLAALQASVAPFVTMDGSAGVGVSIQF